MKRSLRTLAVVLPALLCAVAPALGADKPAFDAYFASPSVTPTQSPAVARAAGQLGAVGSLDARRGVPSFLWSARQPLGPGVATTPAAAARWHVAQRAVLYGVPESVVADAEVVDVHDTGRGAMVVTLRQRYDGIELFHGDIKVMMWPDLSLLAISGSPRGTALAETKKSGRAFTLSPSEAIAKAFTDLYEIPLAPKSLVEKKGRGDYRVFDLGQAPELAASGLRFSIPTRVKKVFFPLPDRMVPAYFLELAVGKASQQNGDAYGYVIAATGGSVLWRSNLKQFDAFNYRVWADAADGRPQDGPRADFTPHPTGNPDGVLPPYVAPIMVSMEGFNHNPSMVADPWLTPTATETLGNNVDAYSDHSGPDGFTAGDIRATTTAVKTFDRTYDVLADPLVTQDQTMASIAHIFYVTNWLHDWFYDSGFTESAGNAQQDNYGRGGVEGDPLHAEAQDGALDGFLNNANMATFADGTSPRMQMYLWSGASSNSLTVQPGNFTPPTGVAAFGPQNFDITASLILSDDGVVSNTNGCEPLINNVAGKVALIDRGGCTFALKTENAQAAGAVGVIIANNVPNVGPPGMGGSSAIATIPVLSVTMEDGATLKTDLIAGPVTVHMQRVTGVNLDGTIDNTVVAHEWGHFLHHRLVTCGLQQCGAMSEGWGDFTALQLVVRPGDNFDGAYAAAIYAVSADANAAYYGIRRVPYSVDFTKDAFTFKHISDGETLPMVPTNGGGQNSEVHNAGEIWATMMFESYVALLKQSTGPMPKYTFDEARRLMSDYVVAGMKLTPLEPTYTQQRDAILGAAYANDPGDMALIAQAFATRGAGTCAVSPPVDSTDLVGVVEDFSVHANYTLLSLDLDDGVFSCDQDGVLDVEETGTISVNVQNTGVTALTGVTVDVSSPTPGVLFPQGTSVVLPTVEPFATGTALVQISLDTSVTAAGFVEITATVNEPTACTPTQAVTKTFPMNNDSVPNSATIDTVEAELVAWTITGTDGDQVWSREQSSPTNHVWHGIDFSSLSDTQLESPSLDVGTVDPFVVTFTHRYQFEFDATENWDGGVIEVSKDGGMSWEDVSVYATVGYTGVIGNQANNPLADRDGFVTENAGFPATETATVDFGATLAGQTVKLRFRLGSDEAVSAFGWEIDDINILGITNKPFASVVDDATDCQFPPDADAGPDQTVLEGVLVTLDGSASSDKDNDPLTFAWTQTAGPNVTLTGADTTGPTFTAPDIAVQTVLTFQLQVSDANASDTDTVDVTVDPIGTGGGGAGGSGGSGGSGGAGGGGAPSTGGSGGAPSTGGSGGAPSTGGSSAEGGATSGGAGPGVDIRGIAAEGGGCNCEAAGSSRNDGWAGAVLLAAAALLRPRRRATRRRRH